MNMKNYSHEYFEEQNKPLWSVKIKIKVYINTYESLNSAILNRKLAEHSLFT